MIAATAVASGALVPVIPDWHIAKGTLYAISLGGRDAPARVRIFREYVRKALAETQLALVPPAL
jgi:DNA-binding transcriptional LysR family regulator